MRRLGLTIGVLFWSIHLGAPVQLRGQATPPPAGASPESTGTDPLCFRISPAPECRSFAFFEFQLAFPTHTFENPVTPGSSYDDRRVEMNFGWLWNFTPEISAGPVITFGDATSETQPDDGVRLRVRWWASERVRLVFEGGVIRSDLDDWVVAASGPTFGARVDAWDRVALGLRWDRMTVQESEDFQGLTVSGLSTTVTAVNKAGVAAGLLYVLLGVVTLGTAW